MSNSRDLSAEYKEDIVIELSNVSSVPSESELPSEEQRRWANQEVDALIAGGGLGAWEAVLMPDRVSPPSDSAGKSLCPEAPLGGVDDLGSGSVFAKPTVRPSKGFKKTLPQPNPSTSKDGVNDVIVVDSNNGDDDYDDDFEIPRIPCKKLRVGKGKLIRPSSSSSSSSSTSASSKASSCSSSSMVSYRGTSVVVGKKKVAAAESSSSSVPHKFLGNRGKVNPYRGGKVSKWYTAHKKATSSGSVQEQQQQQQKVNVLSVGVVCPPNQVERVGEPRQQEGLVVAAAAATAADGIADHGGRIPLISNQFRRHAQQYLTDLRQWMADRDARVAASRSRHRSISQQREALLARVAEMDRQLRTEEKFWQDVESSDPRLERHDRSSNLT